MPRYPDPGPARGSKHWLRVLIKQRPDLLAEKLSQTFTGLTEDTTSWLSPLLNDEYSEYSDQAFLDRIDIQPTNVPLPQFWPNGGPRWDGLGFWTGRGPLLIEAKSHIDEAYTSPCTAGSASRAMIIRSLNETKSYLRSTSPHDWSSLFYQQANRLAHLYFLRELNQIDAYLILVYFFNDDHVQVRTEEEWKGANRLLRRVMGLPSSSSHRLSRYIAEIYINVNDLSHE